MRPGWWHGLFLKRHVGGFVVRIPTASGKDHAAFLTCMFLRLRVKGAVVKVCFVACLWGASAGHGGLHRALFCANPAESGASWLYG